MTKEEMIENLRSGISYNKTHNPQGAIYFSQKEAGYLLDFLTEEKEEITYKEEIRVDGLGAIVNDLETLDLLDIVELRIKSILMNDLHSISLHNTTLSELIKLRDQLRP